jgi:hypothetical protein
MTLREKLQEPVIVQFGRPGTFLGVRQFDSPDLMPALRLLIGTGR